MCSKIYVNTWHEKPKIASVKARAGHGGAGEGGEGNSTWEVAIYPQPPLSFKDWTFGPALLQRDGKPKELCRHSQPRQEGDGFAHARCEASLST